MDYDLQDIRARVTALEFLLKQLYIDAIRSKGGNALESALLTQSMAMHHLPRQISVNQTPENADRMQGAGRHITRLYEEIVQSIERSSRK